MLDRLVANWRRIATILLVVAVVGVLAALALPEDSPIRGVALALSGIVIVGLPGFALAWALRPEGELAPMEFLLAAGALALGIIAIGGIVLNALPFGLNRWSWVGLVAGALLFIWALAPDRAEGVTRLPRLTLFAPHEWLLLGGAAGLMLVAFVIARAGATAPTDPFTQMWVVRGTTPGLTARLGVANHEGAATTYRVVLQVAGSTVQTWPGISLADGAEWTAEVTATVRAGDVLEAFLYREVAPDTVYRQVRLWGPLPAVPALPAAGGAG